MHSLCKFTRMVWTQREGANASDIPEVHAECLQTPVKHEQGYICEKCFGSCQKRNICQIKRSTPLCRSTPPLRASGDQQPPQLLVGSYVPFGKVTLRPCPVHAKVHGKYPLGLRVYGNHVFLKSRAPPPVAIAGHSPGCLLLMPPLQGSSPR